MSNKEIATSPLPAIHDLSRDTSLTVAEGTGVNWANSLKKILHYLKGGKTEKIEGIDPAAAIIMLIEDKDVARIVKHLHYRTPKTLKAMRNACESCFVLPDDCPYYDYSIFDVKKAAMSLVIQPKHIHEKVVAELRKINRELAYHISEYLE